MSLAKPIGKYSNNVSEVNALIEGVLLCRRLGMDDIEIEGDSAIVVNVVRKGSIPICVLNGYISRILESLRDFIQFTINHIYREGNKWVDNLANIGVDGNTLEIFGMDRVEE